LVQLVIYVEEGCFGCARARQIAGELERHHDALDVRVLDLSEVVSLPEAVIAVPAYVLDGRLVSLGNPYLEEISSLIQQSLGEKARHENAQAT
jgi:hypothetical protein